MQKSFSILFLALLDKINKPKFYSEDNSTELEDQITTNSISKINIFKKLFTILIIFCLFIAAAIFRIFFEKKQLFLNFQYPLNTTTNLTLY